MTMALGCAGAIGDSSEDGGPSRPRPPQRCAADSAEAQAIGPAPLRRLTHYEYNNTVRDLLGDTTQPADDFAPQNREGVLDNDVGNLSVSPALFEQYYRAADAIAGRAVAGDGLARVAGCDPAGAMEMTCVRQFIESFGARAYRRPLSADELTSLTASFTTARMGTDARQGVRTVIARMLLSPNFLYRTELGTPVAGRADRRQLTPYEIASRLSYGHGLRQHGDPVHLADRPGKSLEERPPDAHRRLVRRADQHREISSTQLAVARRRARRPRQRDGRRDVHLRRHALLESLGEPLVAISSSARRRAGAETAESTGARARADRPRTPRQGQPPPGHVLHESAIGGSFRSPFVAHAPPQTH
jgi:hypothetical protein